jgi:hypothetical protein
MTLSILCVGKIVNGPIDWRISPLPVDEADAKFDEPSTVSYFAHLMPVDGTIQDIMDIANADILAEEWQEYNLDFDWIRGGC